MAAVVTAAWRHDTRIDCNDAESIKGSDMNMLGIGLRQCISQMSQYHCDLDHCSGTYSGTRCSLWQKHRSLADVSKVMASNQAFGFE